ncbi:MAG TPA: zf-HC2 domain-containing protein [Candidatus Latescibacteria bacterium]|nr:zf-HC2 domain-containing protein [Candidatus Latescibacterota bacterium]
MRCRKAHEYISRSIDGELFGRRAARLEHHLETCGECRALLEDFRTIAGGAAKLDAPEPSDKVWKGIRAGLAAADLKPSREGPGPLFGLSLPALRYAGVAALAVVLVVSGVVIGTRLRRQGTPAGSDRGEKYTLAKLNEAEGHYQAAIKSLSEAFASEKGALVPQVAELFDRNLSVIDATIQACRRAVLEEPDDLQARSYLLSAYTEKVTLLDSALDLQRQDREPAGKRKKIL